ncbi:hypothetical protein GGI12_003008 [Dipsacomyces acuminosporus]|nr:hypothetical protein GGI12_003008 [Dipsacomyces acuminosporus]
MDVQLVMRILRTWDRQGVKQKEFKPVLKVIVPSGVTLPEIREELGRATPNVLLDATSNKELLDTVLSRVTSRNSALTRSQSVGSNSSSGSSGSQLPPPYESSSNAPPPAYTG